MKTDPQLDQLIQDLDKQEILSDLDLWDISDEWVQGDSEDRVNEIGLFEEGFALAKKAGGQDVYRVDNGGSAFYFIGTVPDIIQRIKSAAGVP